MTLAHGKERYTLVGLFPRPLGKLPVALKCSILKPVIELLCILEITCDMRKIIIFKKAKRKRKNLNLNAMPH